MKTIEELKNTVKYKIAVRLCVYGYFLVIHRYYKDYY